MNLPMTKYTNEKEDHAQPNERVAQQACGNSGTANRSAGGHALDVVQSGTRARPPSARRWKKFRAMEFRRLVCGCAGGAPTERG